LAELSNILYGVKLEAFEGNRSVLISKIVFDSRKAIDGCLFVAVKGTQVDGHQFIETAIKSGASAIVCERLPEIRKEGIVYVKTDNAAKALGLIASNFYDNPSKKLTLVGVTGTNGKTTTATLLYQLFTQLGHRCGLLSTIENKIGDQVFYAGYTTPDAVQLNELLATMLTSGCTHAFMEVSSHALVQYRVAGVTFSGAVFTNITHDHLDYHLTFDAYIDAKKLLFDQLSSDAFSLVNADDKRSSYMLQNTRATKNTFGIKSMADFKAKVLHNTLQGLELDIDGTAVWCKLVGTFNAYNLLAVHAAAVLLGKDKLDVLTALSQITGARGRFQLILNKSRVLAIVDYAHTPDALENVLQTIEQLRTKNEMVITVVGCGGDRDKLKRPKMAAIANRYSDKVILTSDNPRTEDPQVILNEMVTGIPKSAERKVMRISDRKEAIRTACQLAGSEDIILVAGKGHEDYQEIMGVRQHFNDSEILNELLNNED